RDAAALTRIIERLFDREVNPRVASHGGQISLVGLEGTTLRIAMGGGCQGCSSSQVTLRGSVEVMVHRVAPEITEIIDVTDHEAGTDPYLRGPVRLAPLAAERRRTERMKA
ncbi:MAG TPA: NifU family protein, partial [Acidimicrobiales bacterium]|nr:NifU family protein [Acidimicrobiales bacterium]